MGKVHLTEVKLLCKSTQHTLNSDVSNVSNVGRKWKEKVEERGNFTTGTRVLKEETRSQERFTESGDGE